jgi:hypothetical protein
VTEQPTDQDVTANAEAAIGETRTQIDIQLKEADSIHAKAAAIVTLTGVAGGIVVGRLHLDTDAQRVAALITALVLAVLLISASQSLRPRTGWSFGADPRALLAIVERYSHKIVLLALAESLVEARELNARVLRAKQEWYARGLRGAVAALLAIGWMIQTGAMR